MQTGESENDDSEDSGIFSEKFFGRRVNHEGNKKGEKKIPLTHQKIGINAEEMKKVGKKEKPRVNRHSEPRKIPDRLLEFKFINPGIVTEGGGMTGKEGVETSEEDEEKGDEKPEGGIG